MAKTANHTTSVQPRAVIHKRILEVAAERPDASLEELSNDVSGATTQLVKRVLDEYGDPKMNAEPNEIQFDTNGTDLPLEPDDEGSDTESESEDAEPAPDDLNLGGDGDAVSPPEQGDAVDVDLSAAQRETLQAIQAHPNATQRDLAELLDISQSTVNNRLNTITGFEWDQRRACADRHLNGASNESAGIDDPAGGNGDEATLENEPASTDEDSQPTADLERRLSGIEQRLDDIASSGRATFDDPALVHTVVQACINADTVSEEEERRIVECLLAE